MVSVSIGSFPSTRPIPILVSVAGPQRYRYRYQYRQLDLNDTDTDTSIVTWISAIPILGIGGQSIGHRYRYRQYRPSLRTRSTCMQNFRVLAQKLSKLCSIQFFTFLYFLVFCVFTLFCFFVLIATVYQLARSAQLYRQVGHRLGSGRRRKQN